MAPEPPLPSGAAPAEPTEAEPVTAAPEGEDTAPTTPPAPPGPSFEFKPMTFFLTFLFLLGLIMIVDQPMRDAVAGGLIGVAFWPLLGFSGQYPLATMCIAAALEMLATALAYNWATDWVKAAKVQKWQAAFRKAQMAAMRSGKKDKIAALQPHQNRLTSMTTEVSMAQLKGLAVTWFLVLAIYTWVFLFLFGCGSGPGSGCSEAAAAVHTVLLGTSLVDLTGKVWIIPFWFLLFTFYTVPFSLLFRRILKHWALQRHAEHLEPPVDAGVPGGTA
ncbi:MAG TPA: EMC3/TMCO1 family protein [Thermoplasmata archaeon]|nr:EMC3/TMCO1 family protein [Thermoplasmata archaeon]